MAGIGQHVGARSMKSRSVKTGRKARPTMSAVRRKESRKEQAERCLISTGTHLARDTRIFNRVVEERQTTERSITRALAQRSE